jgi:putative sterol carrier protein
METAVDEDLYLFGEDGDSIRVSARKIGGAPDLAVRISPSVLRRILEGQETPVEAFLMGNLRARGATADLYMLHALFIAIAEIAVTSPEIREIIEDFQAAKRDL